MRSGTPGLNREMRSASAACQNSVAFAYSVSSNKGVPVVLAGIAASLVSGAASAAASIADNPASPDLAAAVARFRASIPAHFDRRTPSSHSSSPASDQGERPALPMIRLQPAPISRWKSSGQSPNAVPPSQPPLPPRSPTMDCDPKEILHN